MLLDRNFYLFKPYLDIDHIRLPFYSWNDKTLIATLSINVISGIIKKIYHNKGIGYFTIGDKSLCSEIVYINDIKSFSKEFKKEFNPVKTLLVFTIGNIMVQDLDNIKSMGDVKVFSFIRPKYSRLEFICKYKGFKIKPVNDFLFINDKILDFDYSLTEMNKLRTRFDQQIKHL